MSVTCIACKSLVQMRGGWRRKGIGRDRQYGPIRRRDSVASSNGDLELLFAARFEKVNKSHSFTQSIILLMRSPDESSLLKIKARGEMFDFPLSLTSPIQCLTPPVVDL